MTNQNAELPKHELLLKLLKMTASTNDGEALVALRKANQLLASAGWDWDRLLAGKITVVGDPFGGLQRPHAQQSPVPAAAYYAPRQQPPQPPAPQPARARYRPPAATAADLADILGSM